jgi:FlaA1/EpsC-like NDP-sugar epimerase
MITLVGLHEDVDIKVQITGLRPGEKLYEEPLMDNERLLSTPHPMVKVCEARPLKVNFLENVSELVSLDSITSRQDFLDQLKVLVTEYKAHGDSTKAKVEIDDEKNVFKIH